MLLGNAVGNTAAMTHTAHPVAVKCKEILRATQYCENYLLTACEECEGGGC